MPKKTPEVFKEAIEKAVGTTSSYYELPKQGIVCFEVGREFDFPTAHKVSKILGTDNIKMSSQYSGGGCDSCGFGEEYSMEITCREVKFPEGR